MCREIPENLWNKRLKNRKDANLSRVAFYGFHGGPGGIGRVMVNLMNGMADRGVAVDCLLTDRRCADAVQLHPAVRLVPVGKPALATAVPRVAAYLRRECPHVLISNKERSNRIALAAKGLGCCSTRLFIRVGTNITSSLEKRPPLKRWLRRQAIRFVYPRVDGIIANSRGVAEDIACQAEVNLADIRILPNPTIPADLSRLASEAVDHPWFAAGSPPVLLGVGRLEAVKDFATLIRAFRRVHDRRPCRLMILGEGQQRKNLEKLAAELGVSGDTHLPGFIGNPFSYMRKASLFVLSSRQEGSPNVLIEALAVGTPAVATDCPSGPREILQDGKIGLLAGVGDDAGLAEAILATLDRPPAATLLEDAVTCYKPETSVSAYLQALGLMPNPAPGRCAP
jgi:glycosyltransferase involved in cell wall biosynthesis